MHQIRLQFLTYFKRELARVFFIFFTKFSENSPKFDSKMLNFNEGYANKLLYEPR